MPTRIIREGILTSDAVNSLSFEAEVFYRRLMSAVDDFGRFDARPSVLLGRLYPLKLHAVSVKDVARWLGECERAGLVSTYSVDGKPYLAFHKLGAPRSKLAKFPAPPQLASAHRQCADANSQSADVPYSYSGSGTDTSSSTEDAYASSCPVSGEAGSGPQVDEATPAPTAALVIPDPPAAPPVLSFPCKGTGPRLWNLTAAKLAEWQDAYPGVDALTELRKARQWLIDNPTRGKTFAGMARFLGGWLGRAQDRGGSRPAARPGLFDNAGRSEARAVAQVREALADCFPPDAPGTQPGGDDP